MKILQVNYCDLPGRVFNGFNLQQSLNERGIISKQVVLDKYSYGDDSIKLCSDREMEIRSRLIELEREYGMLNLLEPFRKHLTNIPFFKEADIVHYHIIHLYMLPLQSLGDLFGRKPSVWTLHDPWAITGRCVHPLDCNQWKTGCLRCKRTDEAAFPTHVNKEAELWKIKWEIFNKIRDKIDLVVASDWMMDKIKKSPLTGQIKNIHKIPFGIKLEDYENVDRYAAKKELKIPPNNIVIGFRAENDPLKGVKFVLEALKNLQVRDNITILTVGHMNLPEDFRKMFHVIELGWQEKKGVEKFFAVTDIFLMPSLAESFGLMAIEAMASECVVVVFEGTALENITQAPECGVSVRYKSVEHLYLAIERLISDEQERKRRAKKGRQIVSADYQYEQYVSKHIELYNEILQRKNVKNQQIVTSPCNYKSGIGLRKRKLQNIQLRNMLLSAGNLSEGEIAFCSNQKDGLKIYRKLIKELDSVEYIVGNYNWKLEGDLGTAVILEDLSQIPRPENTIVILPKEETILKEKALDIGVAGVVDETELEFLIKQMDLKKDLAEMSKIEELDYSDVRIEKIMQSFGETVEEVCLYYEEKIKNHMNQ